jgi:hypothetical protein
MHMSFTPRHPDAITADELTPEEAALAVLILGDAFVPYRITARFPG